MDDPIVDAREITVGGKDREITSDHTVDSRREEKCADNISSVAHVQNNLRVRPVG